MHRQAFLGHITRFFDYYLGNRAVNNRIVNMNDIRKTGLLNGLLGVALADELDDLWGNLDANTKKMIVQDSAQAVLDCVQQGTHIVGNIHDITNMAEYNIALNDIVDEIETHDRMVVVVFQNTNDSQDSHACIAYATQRGNPPLSTLQRIAIFNPWGNLINMTQLDHGPLFNITNIPGAPRSWVLNKYVAFNY